MEFSYQQAGRRDPMRGPDTPTGMPLVRAETGNRCPGDLVATAGGGIRIDSYVPTRTVELVVHGFDIAAATARTVAFAPETVVESLTVMVRTGVQQGAGPVLLAAVTGRGSLLVGLSVV